jgi:hypothetical protein
MPGHTKKFSRGPVVDQGDQMSLGKNRPKMQPSHIFSKLIPDHGKVAHIFGLHTSVFLKKICPK